VFVPTYAASRFRTIYIFRTLSNKIIIQVKLVGMSKNFHCTKLHLYKCNGSWVVSIRQNMNFNFQLPSPFVFLVSQENGLIKSWSSFEDLSAYKTVWSHVHWCKFCIHLRSMNVRHFGTVEVTRLNLWRRGYLQCHDLHTEFHNILLTASKVIRDDTQTEKNYDFISIALYFKESGLIKW
jgi:hypothetical protein